MILFLSVATAASANRHFVAAFNHGLQKRYAEAVDLFREGLKHEPNNGMAHYYLAQALLKLPAPNREAAFFHFVKAESLLEQTPEKSIAISEVAALKRGFFSDYYARGTAAAKRKAYGEAVRHLTLAIGLAPTSVDAARSYSDRGDVWVAQNDIKAGILDYDKAISLDKTRAVYYNNRGLLWYQSGHYDGAVADLDRAVELDRNDSDYPKHRAVVLDKRGVQLYGKGQYREAIADFDRAIAAVARASYYHNRGSAHLAMGNRNSALADIERAISLDGNMALAVNLRGVLRYDAEQYDLALDDFNRAIALDQTKPNFFFNRALSWDKKGESQKAILDLSRAIALDPNNPRSYRSRSTVYSKTGEAEKAAADAARSKALESQSQR